MEDNPNLLVVGHTASDFIINLQNFPETNTSAHVDSLKNLQGGAAANVAAVAATLGLNTTLISAVGDNFSNSEYYFSLKNLGINTDYFITVENELIPTAIMVNDNKKDTITYFYEGSGKGFTDAKVPVDAIESADAIHLATGDPDYNWKVSCEVKKQNKILSFDPGQDLNLYSLKRLKQVIENSTILFGNNFEIDNIINKLNLDVSGLLDLGPEIIIKTCRENGSYIYTENKVSHVDAIYRPAVDPTGAGDSYKAGFLYYYLNGKSLIDSAKFASSVSSFIVEKQGCQTNMPSLELARSRMINFYKD